MLGYTSVSTHREAQTNTHGIHPNEAAKLDTKLGGESYIPLQTEGSPRTARV